MKLGKDALIEIMYILQTGLLEQRDVSEMLRKLDLVQDNDNLLSLTQEYKESKKDS